MRIDTCVLFAALTLLGACSQTVLQNPPIVPDRPGFSDGAVPVAKGMVQASAGYSATHAAQTTTHALGEGLIRVGLSNAAELRLHPNSFLVERAAGRTNAGLQDSKAGVKLALPALGRGPAVPALAAVVATTFPTGATRFSGSQAQPEAKLALGWVVGRTAITSNIGVSRTGFDSAESSTYAFSTSVFYSITPRLNGFLEVLGTHSQGTGGFFDGGVTYRLNNDLQLDVWSCTSTGTAEAQRLMGFGIARQWRAFSARSGK